MRKTAPYLLVGNRLILGIGRAYTAGEREEIRTVAKYYGFRVPVTCSAGIYFKREVAK